jgi:elongation factor G
VGALELLQGKTQTPVPEVQAGDLGAVAKLKETQTATRWPTRRIRSCTRAWRSRSRRPPSPSSQDAGDDDKISGALHRLMEETRS